MDKAGIKTQVIKGITDNVSKIVMKISEIKDKRGWRFT
jgi:hypothetical protein